MVPHRFRNSFISSKAFLEEDFDSDHVLVADEIRLKLKRLRKSMKNPKLQIHHLKTNLEMKEKFRIKVRNRFEVLCETREITHSKKNVFLRNLCLREGSLRFRIDLPNLRMFRLSVAESF